MTAKKFWDEIDGLTAAARALFVSGQLAPHLSSEELGAARGPNFEALTKLQLRLKELETTRDQVAAASPTDLGDHDVAMDRLKQEIRGAEVRDAALWRESKQAKAREAVDRAPDLVADLAAALDAAEEMEAAANSARNRALAAAQAVNNAWDLAPGHLAYDLPQIDPQLRARCRRVLGNVDGKLRVTPVRDVNKPMAVYDGKTGATQFRNMSREQIAAYMRSQRPSVNLGPRMPGDGL